MAATIKTLRFHHPDELVDCILIIRNARRRPARAPVPHQFGGVNRDSRNGASSSAPSGAGHNWSEIRGVPIAMRSPPQGKPLTTIPHHYPICIIIEKVAPPNAGPIFAVEPRRIIKSREEAYRVHSCWYSANSCTHVNQNKYPPDWPPSQCPNLRLGRMTFWGNYRM